MPSDKSSTRSTEVDCTDSLDDSTSSGTACNGWSNEACEGTPLCPPRCPRFFDRTGTPLLAVPFREEYLVGLVDMYESITSRSQGLPPMQRDLIREWLSNLETAGWNLVVFEEETIVGHVGVAPDDAAAPSLVIFVRDEYQGRGIGTELVAQTVAHAAAGGHEELKLLVTKWNDPAITVYTNLGFTQVDQSTNDVEMRLDLDDPIADAVQLPPAERSI